MTKLVESDLEFNFSSSLEAIRFDCEELHGKKSTMSRVDFFIEETNCYKFLEVKDPDCPNVKDVGAFEKKLRAGNLVSKLAAKYRDSLLFQILSQCDGNENDPVKELHYVVVLSMKSLEPVFILNLQDRLQSELPISNKNWGINIVQKCIILNLEQYKNQFGEHSVRRISESGT